MADKLIKDRLNGQEIVERYRDNGDGTWSLAMASGANAVATATLQSAATALGNGTPMDVSGMATVLVQATMTGTATVTCEASIDDVTWIALTGELTSAGGLSTSITQTSSNFPFRYTVTGYKSFRSRVSAYTSGNITVIARAQANEGPLPQTNVALYGAGVATAITTGSAADGSTNGNGLFVNAQTQAYNGTNWDRFRANTDVTLLASAARTANTSSANQTNYNGRGILVYLNITAASGTGGLQVQIAGFDAVSAVGFVLNANTTALTTTGRSAYELYPGSSAAIANHVVQRTAAILPRTWFVTIVHGDASSYTYSVTASVIL